MVTTEIVKKQNEEVAVIKAWRENGNVKLYLKCSMFENYFKGVGLISRTNNPRENEPLIQFYPVRDLDLRNSDVPNIRIAAGYESNVSIYDASNGWFRFAILTAKGLTEGVTMTYAGPASAEIVKSAVSALQKVVKFMYLQYHKDINIAVTISASELL